jgi:hypothetical protein
VTCYYDQSQKTCSEEDGYICSCSLPVHSTSTTTCGNPYYTECRDYKECGTHSHGSTWTETSGNQSCSWSCNDGNPSKGSCTTLCSGTAKPITSCSDSDGWKCNGTLCGNKCDGERTCDGCPAGKIIVSDGQCCNDTNENKEIEEYRDCESGLTYCDTQNGEQFIALIAGK